MNQPWSFSSYGSFIAITSSACPASTRKLWDGEIQETRNMTDNKTQRYLLAQPLHTVSSIALSFNKRSLSTGILIPPTEVVTHYVFVSRFQVELYIFTVHHQCDVFRLKMVIALSINSWVILLQSSQDNNTFQEPLHLLGVCMCQWEGAEWVEGKMNPDQDIPIASIYSGDRSFTTAPGGTPE